VNAWAYILSKAKAFAVFDVQIGLGLYRNMMFESGSAKQEKDSMGILRAAINLKQVTFALTSSVLYPPRGPKKTQRAAAPKTDGGRKESPETDKKKPVSVLAGLLGIKK
jgi:hypothetical protein